MTIELLKVWGWPCQKTGASITMNPLRVFLVVTAIASGGALIYNIMNQQADKSEQLKSGSVLIQEPNGYGVKGQGDAEPLKDTTAK